jgi:aminobenzoyl-glutamate utilization protein B
MDAQAARFGDVSRALWEQPEVGYRETRSAARLTEELKAAGFRVEAGVAGIPTAFVATWGSGRPVVALLAEYDALPGLSQADRPERQVLVEGGAGHGCGHNLLGAGAVFAGVAARDVMAAKGLPGTLKVIGTPAEEGGGGKVYLARAGVFAGVDAVLAWHPSDRNTVPLGTTLANVNARFRFRGQAAHAASSPDRGRSSLDAVLLTAHAVEMLREHVPQETRLHYVITKGGDAPNVVPGLAELYVYARHPDMAALDGIWSRVEKCAQAGALATETRLEAELVNSVYNLRVNPALAALLERNLRRVGGVAYSPDERVFAERLAATFAAPEGPSGLGSERRVHPGASAVSSSSTDLGDVSWQVPTAELHTATFVPGTPGHSWQSTACAGSAIGRRGMVVAAKTLALSALELLTVLAEVAAARSSFDAQQGGHAYRSRVPPEKAPPLDYRERE